MRRKLDFLKLGFQCYKYAKETYTLRCSFLASMKICRDYKTMLFMIVNGKFLLHVDMHIKRNIVINVSKIRLTYHYLCENIKYAAYLSNRTNNSNIFFMLCSTGYL